MWEGMKRDISKFVEECTNCQQVKDGHLKTGGLTQLIEIQLPLFVQFLRLDILFLSQVFLSNSKFQCISRFWCFKSIIVCFIYALYELI